MRPSAAGTTKLTSCTCGKTTSKYQRVETGEENRHLLWGTHFVCFIIHASCAITTVVVAGDNDMSVDIFRVRPDWKNTGRNGYKFDTVHSDVQIVNISTLTWLFFGISATSHGMWVFFGFCTPLDKFLWDQLTHCICWW